MTRATLLAALLALTVPATAQAAEWDYDKTLTQVKASLSHPGRWDYSFVTYLSRTTIVEGRKRRTGTRRYFVVTQHPGRLRVDHSRGPFGCLLLAAVALDEVVWATQLDPEQYGARCRY